jgi:hypothetical protein
MLATDPLVYGKKQVNEWLWEQTRGVVQSGPFKGMEMLREESWDDGNSGTKILGCYEQELHGPISEEITRLLRLDAPVVANVGCAEGFYAVGMARRLPRAKVLIVDISDEAVAIAHKAAALNEVELVTASVDEALESPDLVIMDCEGGEQGYLDPVVHPGLVKAVIIVEIHESDDGHYVNDLIYSRFWETHDVYFCLSEGSREPLEMPLLKKLASHYRWLAVSEGRPQMMNYLVMRPKP